ncbi:zinc knuckle [Ancylostoma ceylanicum]|uniref:RNA-directed DNA polymerase n=1 Tax=Ancylostoma ceylanicum TaxID=53326 RepID=A0A0D6LR69_9BILA|nr:zinc knuckle [Ancylostoma ceylanicum]
MSTTPETQESVGKVGGSAAVPDGGSSWDAYRGRAPGPSVDCRICGKRGHIAANCYLRGKAHCRLCSKPGHIARTCWSKRPQAGSLRKVNWCAESDELDSDSEESILLENVHTINMLQVGRELTKKLVTRRSRREVPVQRWRRDPESLVRKSDTRRSRCEVPAELLRQEELNEVEDIRSGEVLPMVNIIEPPIMLVMRINDVPVQCELDTGAAISIMDEKTWKLVGRPPVKPANLEAMAYNNSSIRFRGKCRVKVEFNGTSLMREIFLLPQASHPLCGRDLIKAMHIDCGPYVGVNQLGNSEVKAKLDQILQENKELFSAGLGKCTSTKAVLKFREDKPHPKFFRARPVPIALRPKVEAKLEELVRNGTLVRVDHSEWGTPLVVVPKPGGKIRLCGDYKVTINPQLDINQYPLPKPDDLFHMLNGGTKFSKMDLSDAYMQVELEEESRKYTTINTHKGLFEYTRVPFGVAPAPAIFSKYDGENASRDRRGHVIDAQGIRPSPEKVKAMVNMPEPKNIKVESFLGMVQYYGKFVPNLATLAAPLNELRQKGKRWNWGEDQKKAFHRIKKRLTEADVLAHYDPNVPYKNTAEFANADGLSRLPDPRELPSAEMVIDEVVINQLADESWRDLPLSETEVAKAIQEDPVLRVVYTLVKNGWHKKNADKELQPFEQRKSELTLYKDCLMWGNRVVIPVKFKRRVLKMLHCLCLLNRRRLAIT